MFLGSKKHELEAGFLRSGRRFRSGKRKRQREVDELLVCSKKESMKFSHRWKKDLANKRRIIAWFMKEQKSQRTLQRHQYQDATRSH